MTVPKSFSFHNKAGSKQFSYSWDGAQEWCLDDDFRQAAYEFIAKYAPHRVSFTLTRENYFSNAGNIRRWLQQNARGWWHHESEQWDRIQDTYTITLDMEDPRDLMILKLYTNFENFEDIPIG